MQYRELKAIFLNAYEGFMILVGVGIVVLAIYAMQGCAAGRADNGAVILGFEAARLAETPGEMLRSASDALPFPWNYVAGAGSALLVGTGGYKVSTMNRRREDAAWDESQNNAMTMLMGMLAGKVGATQNPVPTQPITPTVGA